MLCKIQFTWTCFPGSCMIQSKLIHYRCKTHIKKNISIVKTCDFLYHKLELTRSMPWCQWPCAHEVCSVSDADSYSHWVFQVTFQVLLYLHAVLLRSSLDSMHQLEITACSHTTVILSSLYFVSKSNPGTEIWTLGLFVIMVPTFPFLSCFCVTTGVMSDRVSLVTRSHIFYTFREDVLRFHHRTLGSLEGKKNQLSRNPSKFGLI